MSHRVVTHRLALAGRIKLAGSIELIATSHDSLERLSVHRQRMLGPVRLYAEVRMTPSDMANMLPARTKGIEVKEQIVSIWGDWIPSGTSLPPGMTNPKGANWSGISDWASSPFRDWLQPKVARATMGMMDDEDARNLLHLTGFLTVDADAVAVLRFLSAAAHA